MKNQSTQSLLLPPENLTPSEGSPERKIFQTGHGSFTVWCFDRTKPQAVTGTARVPINFQRIKVSIIVCPQEKVPDKAGEMVFKVTLSQGDRIVSVFPVRGGFAVGEFVCRELTLSVGFDPDPALPLELRIERLHQDPADTFRGVVGLTGIRIAPVPVLATPLTVQDVPGYNSWPMIQAIGSKLVCAYSRGLDHSITETCRSAYARTSADGGKTWTAETCVADLANVADIAGGSGLDENGAMLLWIRVAGEPVRHELYRSADGVKFTRIATLKPDPIPMQVMDVFAVPGTGLMAFWFGGNYRDEQLNSWGTLVSADNGKSWKQQVIARGMPKTQFPTETSAVYLGDGRILAIARTEIVGRTTDAAQFQLESIDSGKTWTCARTNIGDVCQSTPSLIYDPVTNLVSNYEYQRSRGLLKRRVVRADRIFGRPLEWPDSEIVAIGSSESYHAGNVKVTVIGNTHYPAYYSGNSSQTAIIVAPVPAPEVK